MPHRRGSVCASVLHTRDVERATAFYTTLFGWSSADGPADRGHRRWLSDGAIVALARQSPSLDEWVPHISVDDIEGTLDAAGALGATVVERADASGHARLAVLRDPEGARFGLWQPSPAEGVERTEGAGSLWWVEVLSDDPPRARQFYASLFGWRTRETAFEPFETYTVFERDGIQEGGVLPIRRDWDVTPHWNSIFEVADCDGTMNRACELGGSAGFVHTVPKHGRIGSIVDPGGGLCWLRGPGPVHS
jgi:predicted enzyme related to lactoylglutathione lyase